MQPFFKNIFYYYILLSVHLFVCLFVCCFNVRCCVLFVAFLLSLSLSFFSFSLFFLGGGGRYCFVIVVVADVCLFVCFLIGRFLCAGMHMVQN